MTDPIRPTASAPSDPPAPPDPPAAAPAVPAAAPAGIATGRAAELCRVLLAGLDQIVVGQHAAAELLLAGYLAGGHVLLEGVPGIGKTLLARAFAALLGAGFRRVQFTPDLMPADLVGTNVFDAESRSFELVPGPVFTEVLMADEINRTPPKTQSALLEAMQERQVSIDGETRPLDPELFVVATQNPIEFEGTYPLPEAQLDRFLLRVELGLPDAAAERELYRRAAEAPAAAWSAGGRLPDAAIARAEARALRHAARAVHFAPELTDYLARLAEAVRSAPEVELGPSPRAALALIEASRAIALLAGRDFVVPDDLKRLLRPVWGHRIILSAESELEGRTVARLLEEVAGRVEVPHH